MEQFSLIQAIDWLCQGIVVVCEFHAARYVYSTVQLPVDQLMNRRIGMR